MSQLNLTDTTTGGASLVAGVPYMPWADFRAKFAADWKQGEHVTLVGPTGCGKTTLAVDILSIRKHVIVLATKPRDPVAAELEGRDGFRLTRKWPPNETWNRVIYWPKSETREDIDRHRDLIDDAIDDMFVEGGWCIYVDELRYLSEYLRLEKALKLLWTQGRSLGLTIVGGTQRPAWVPLDAYSQATHLFLWRDNDETNLRRLRGLGGVNGTRLRDAVESAPHHVVVYSNTRTGELIASRVE